MTSTLLFCVIIKCVEYYCESDRFPLVTDLAPEDCDNAGGWYYRENVVNDCFPACKEAAKLASCGTAQCPPGYYCAGTRCALNNTSCYRYHVSATNQYTMAMWKPTCLTDGSWAPKQCKGEAANGRCFCFDGLGNRIFGDAFSLEAADMTCACSRRRAELEKYGSNLFVSLHCDSMGNYDPLQCEVESEQCWCVEPKTGDVTSIVLPMSLMEKLPCYNATTIGTQYLRQCESELYAQNKIIDEFLAHGTLRLNFETILCQYDGGYGPYKVEGGIVYCVWKDGSNLVYQTAVDSSIDSINCNCARDQKIYSQAGLILSLSCSSNGNYAEIQMDGTEYFCVDEDGFIKSENMDVEPFCADYF